MTYKHIFQDGTWTIFTKDKHGNIIEAELGPREGCAMDEQEKKPKTQREYWNSETQTMVSYQRARQLGINTEEEPPIHLKYN